MGGFDLAQLFLERWRLPGSQVSCFEGFVCFVLLGLLKLFLILTE